ncbi:alpha-L-fucosidase [Prolixibacteraceae bacterium JC049]|nr:alpha-L-fucosidase [Prolixibacteraceae bacterium JC049]
MKFFHSTIFILAIAFFYSCQKTEAPSPVLPVPNKAQIAWNEMERNAFIHFGLNTFNDMEWGYGDSPASTFNPSSLDAEQWCKVIKDAGMKGVVLTCKHHDGFCLWPFKGTEYSVKNSPWRNGKGDLVKEVSDACKKYGLKFGVYLSPWDRNSALYGTPEYITYFREQLTDLLTNYGEVFEVWFDGANGGTGYYGGTNERRSVDRKTYYDWPTTIELVRKLQPNAMIFSDGGPDIRWCGNESGIGGRTNWSTLKRDEVWPGWPRYKELNPGHEDGNYWVPAEINTSVRPGWFYHKSEDHKVKDLPRLMDYFYESVGRNGTALLNFPVDHRGLIHEIDAANVIQWQKTIEADLANNLLKTVGNIEASNVRGNSSKFEADNVNDGDKNSYWATDDNTINASLIFEFKKPVTFNRFLAQEYIALGQRVKAFSLEIKTDEGKWKEIADETTIGYKRILRLPTVTTKVIRFAVKDAKACPTISNIELYNAPQLITSPIITRNKNGVVTINSANKELDIYYTTNGAAPTLAATKYTQPFKTNGKVEVKAIAVDPSSKNKSSVVSAKFDILHTNWVILKTNDKRSKAVIDGNPHSEWSQSAKKMPIDLTIDLGKTYPVKGFKYLPGQSRWTNGIIFNYEFYTSVNGRSWKKQQAGEFSNIQNHPVWQEKTFKATNARFVRLRAISNTKGDTKAGYAEFDILTQ